MLGTTPGCPAPRDQQSCEGEPWPILLNVFLDRQLPLSKLDLVLSHEVLENSHVDTVTDMEYCTVPYSPRGTIAGDLHVHIEIKVEMIGARLHSPYTSLRVEGRSATLPSKPRR
jgi:hypothetical protein